MIVGFPPPLQMAGTRLRVVGDLQASLPLRKSLAPNAYAWFRLKLQPQRNRRSKNKKSCSHGKGAFKNEIL
jgi:hypothetical protein